MDDPRTYPRLAGKAWEAPHQDLSGDVGACGGEASVTVGMSGSVCLTWELSVAVSLPISTDCTRGLLRSQDARFGGYNEGELAYLTSNAAFSWDVTDPQIL